MDLQLLTTFFMWCSAINGGILTLWAVIFFLMPDFIYRMHRKWLPISKDTYHAAIYGLVGVYKLLFIVFNLVPYIALSILGS